MVESSLTCNRIGLLRNLTFLPYIVASIYGAHICAEGSVSMRLSCAESESLLDLYLVPLRQSRDLVVGQMRDQVLSDDLQVRLLQRSRNPLQNG